MSNANDFVHKNLWKIGLATIFLFVVLKKDINIQLNLSTAKNEKTNNTVTAEEVVKPEFMSLGEKTPMTDKIVKTTKTQHSKRIGNLTLVMSPDYAKRNNIDPKLAASKKKTCSDYVARFANVAQTEMEKYGIPASITLAQGLLESNVGESRLATGNKNHFGIKCFSRNCKKGHCSNHTDDSHKDFFRVYKSVWESYRAHSVFLQGKRYKHLLKLGTTNYKGWAHGLRKAGYATDPKYANKLITIIENLNLSKYDK